MSFCMLVCGLSCAEVKPSCTRLRRQRFVQADTRRTNQMDQSEDINTSACDGRAADRASCWRAPLPAH